MRSISMVLAFFGVGALALVTPLAAQGRADPPPLASELRAYEELAEEAEGWHADMERDGNAFFAWADSEEDLTEAEAAVARYLTDHPDDAAALVLRARLLQLIGLHGNVLTIEQDGIVIEGQGDIPDRVRVLLRRAVEAAPQGWADPYYRLGRVYLQPRAVEGPEGVRLKIDADSALLAARRALELAPRNREYRTLVGEASLAAGDTATALELLPGLGDELRLVGQIRGDLDGVPIPPDAVEGGIFLPTYAAMLIQSQFRLYPQERTRSWLLPLSVEAIEAFYKERWEDFRFFTDDPAAGEAVGEEIPGMYMQHFRRDGQQLVPARNDRDVDRGADGKTEGVLFLLASHRVVPAAMNRMDNPPEFIDRLPLAEIVLVSMRREPR
jgi:tetratricopeptide (TPR) repeat protein